MRLPLFFFSWDGNFQFLSGFCKAQPCYSLRLLCVLLLLLQYRPFGNTTKCRKMLFNGALLPVVVQTAVRSPEGDVYVHTNWCLFLVIVGLQVTFSVPQLGDAFEETIRFCVIKITMRL